MSDATLGISPLHPVSPPRLSVTLGSWTRLLAWSTLPLACGRTEPSAVARAHTLHVVNVTAPTRGTRTKPRPPKVPVLPEAAAPTALGDAIACTLESWTPVAQPVQLMLVVDASSNATEGNDNEVDWANIEQAIDEFAKAPLHAGSSAGLTLLPRPLSPGSDSVSCLPEDYATPELGLTPLPSEKFFSVLHGAGSMRWAGADVPLPAALRGSISGLESNADWNLPVAAVLVAAGLFSGCGDEPITTDAITDAAIYVMGVGSWLADASRAPWSLRYWSKQTFGRATAHIGTSLEELRQTLEQFWLFAGSCSFMLPKAALQPDARLFATQDGVEQQLNENPSCDAAGSYFVDDASDTGASEVTLHLCESDCSSLAHQAALGSLGLRWETCAQ